MIKTISALLAATMVASSFGETPNIPTEFGTENQVYFVTEDEMVYAFYQVGENTFTVPNTIGGPAKVLLVGGGGGGAGGQGQDGDTRGGGFGGNGGPGITNSISGVAKIYGYGGGGAGNYYTAANGQYGRGGAMDGYGDSYGEGQYLVPSFDARPGEDGTGGGGGAGASIVREHLHVADTVA